MGSLGTVSPREEYRHPLITERAVDEPKSLKVVYIGAGISGICAAMLFPRFAPNLDLAIYEKNPDVGGTWYENRYPGCACDIPAHSYQLSFESWTEWSKFYATAPEIFEYWTKVAEKHDVKKYMRFQQKCVEARWDEETCKWHIKIEKLVTGEVFEDICDIFVTGIGFLNDWKYPDIKGIQDFKGTLLHSAVWDEKFDPKASAFSRDKAIAVIGGGSSGIQIVPTLLPDVSSMDHYVRGRTWIAATFGSDLVRERNDGKDGNFGYTEEEKEQWRKDPKSYIRYRKALERGMQGTYAVTHRDSPEHNSARALFDQDMRKRLANKPEIIDHLLPNFPPLCKRLTPGPGYLEALTSPKVHVIPTGISHIDATGITTTDGHHRPVDAIICATGFDTSYRGRFPIYGINGIKLQDRYSQRPETYLSMCTDGFPNFFQSLGPNAGLGNGNLIILIEAVHLYIAQVLRKLSLENIRTIAPKPMSVQNFTDYCDAYFKRTVFSAECGSWYKSSPPGSTWEDRLKGRVTALWPGSSVHAVKVLERPRWEDFDYTPGDGNPFGWFGDGWTVAERTGDHQGLTYYIDDTKFLHKTPSEEADPPPVQPRKDSISIMMFAT